MELSISIHMLLTLEILGLILARKPTDICFKLVSIRIHIQYLKPHVN